MVEGPGCKVKGELMKNRIKGKSITTINLPMHTKKIFFNNFCGLEVETVRTMGKELFIFFGKSQTCLRVHFLMDGYVRYGNFVDKKPGATDFVLQIGFHNHDSLTIFKSSIDIRPAAESFSYCDSFADLDICSPVFNFIRAQQKIEEKPSDIICDVIMDQAILPGVGNIIKNEGLFKSGINPLSRVQDLSPVLVSCLLHRLRDFSAVFYMCRKRGKSLKTHLSIYEKTKCSQCENKITVSKPGSLRRLTFHCNVCQINSNLSLTPSFPSKNSILGFIQFPDSVLPKDDWECARCTYINTSPALSCLMCACPHSISLRKRKSFVDEHLSGSSCKKVKVDSEYGKPQDERNSFNQEEKSDMARKNEEKPPLCPGHQRLCSKKTVTRCGENKGRLFYCCSVGGNKQCKFFQWADFNHPLCKHKKRTILRRVLKQSENNGKEFYCCPFPKDKQCNFFQWV